jgi:aldehyde:ferredoxin oxidoreductase
MDGWHGRSLRIVPRPRRTAYVASGDRVYRDFRGGVGLGTWTVAHEMPAGTDPLAPEAALAFAFSPLVGSPLTTSAKFAVVALSPLTGRVCDALASSHFAIAAKRAGIDALAITRACETPIVAFGGGMSTDEPHTHGL